VAHDVERAAALDAWRVGVVLEAHDDIDGDLGVRLDTIEVDVDRLIRHRVELHRARDHRLLLALVVQFHHVRQKLARADRHFDVLGVDFDRDRAAGAAIEHAGDEPRIAGRAGAAGAGLFALLDVQNDASHGL
jgi:hypothetical protein